jgi:hypothetical protein
MQWVFDSCLFHNFYFVRGCHYFDICLRLFESESVLPLFLLFSLHLAVTDK